MRVTRKRPGQTKQQFLDWPEEWVQGELLPQDWQDGLVDAENSKWRDIWGTQCLVRKTSCSPWACWRHSLHKPESSATPGEQSLRRGCTLALSKHYQVPFLCRIAERKKIPFPVGGWGEAYFGNISGAFWYQNPALRRNDLTCWVSLTQTTPVASNGRGK